jgi:hypothetical protein
LVRQRFWQCATIGRFLHTAAASRFSKEITFWESERLPKSSHKHENGKIFMLITHKTPQLVVLRPLVMTRDPRIVLLC